MGLREEIAKVRLARSRLAITRAKLEQLDEEKKRLERQTTAPPQPPSKAPRQGRRRRFDLD